MSKARQQLGRFWLMWGFEAPQWAELAMGRRPPGWADDEDPTTPKHGWQYWATQPVNAQFMEATVRPRLNSTVAGLVAFSRADRWPAFLSLCCPVTRQSSFDSQVFRVLLLRRLWLPLPSSSRACRCGRPLDPSGHHRAACAVAGVLGRRGFAVESAAARVCREAGGRVTTNVRIQDMDIVAPNRFDERRVEVLADGLPPVPRRPSWLWTPLWCLCWAENGEPRPRCADVDGVILEEATRRKAPVP